MEYFLVTVHLISLAIALGGRILFIPIIFHLQRNGLNDRLDPAIDSFNLTQWVNFALVGTILSGVGLVALNGQPLIALHWALKLKLIFLFLLIVDLVALYLAQLSVKNRYDQHMIPVISRLNGLAVLLMCCMVFFASFSIN